MEASMVNAGLQMALRRREIGKGLMIHSDQGIQYASRQFTNLVEAKDIVQSMIRKGDCWDNSIAESFFATIKKRADS